MANSIAHAPGILTSLPIARCGVGDDRLPDLPSLPARWWCDLSDDSLTWEGGVFDLFGISRGARLDRRETVAMYTDSSRAILNRLRSAAIATRGSFTFEAEIVRADGTTRWMRVVADTIASNGRVTHLYGTKCDISREVYGAPVMVVGQPI